MLFKESTELAFSTRSRTQRIEPVGDEVSSLCLYEAGEGMQGERGLGSTMGHQSERQEWPVDEDKDEDEDLMGRGGRPGGEGPCKTKQPPEQTTRAWQHNSSLVGRRRFHEPRI